MTARVYRFSFGSDIPIDEAEMTLQLATFAAEGLFGIARVRLDFTYQMEVSQRAIVVDGTSDVGVIVVHLFVGLLLREFGEESFRVERVTSNMPPPEKVAA